MSQSVVANIRRRERFLAVNPKGARNFFLFSFDRRATDLTSPLPESSRFSISGYIHTGDTTRRHRSHVLSNGNFNYPIPGTLPSRVIALSRSSIVKLIPAGNFSEITNSSNPIVRRDQLYSIELSFVSI